MNKDINDFKNQNKGIGYLKVRAYAANGAIPVRGLNITITKNIDNNIITLFEGSTNESGLIDKIELPAPKITTSDLVIPSSITYDLRAFLKDQRFDKTYKVNIFDGVSVIQNISISPDNEGSIYGN